MLTWITADIGVFEFSLASFVNGFGLGCIWAPTMTLMFNTLPPAYRTEGATLVNLARSYGSGVGIAVAAVVLARSHGIGYAELGEHVSLFREALEFPEAVGGWSLETQTGLAALRHEISRQAFMLGVLNNFLWAFAAAALAAPLAFLFRRRAEPRRAAARTRGRVNNADLIVATLGAAGIRHGFGIPSGNVLPLMEAMRAGGIAFVLTAHEGSAAFCADVAGRLSGRPGLCIATLGPGATNLATGVGGAWLDRSPMLAVTCNLETGRLGRRMQMAIDHHALFAPITKASLALRSGEIVPALESAIRIALSEPPGPVHLDLPEDVALAPARESAPASVPGRTAAPAPDAGAVARAAALIGAAARPLAVIGASALRMRDPGLLRRFVEHHCLPFASTTMAKGLIDEDHPLSVGCIERARRQLQRRFLQRADLVVGLGYDTVEVELRGLDRGRARAADRYRAGRCRRQRRARPRGDRRPRPRAVRAARHRSRRRALASGGTRGPPRALPESAAAGA